MRRPNLTMVLAVTAAVAGASSAMAGGRGSTPPTTPPGFNNAGGHNGFQAYPGSGTTDGTSQTTYLPRGWDEGNAAWKQDLTGQNPNPAPRPPGLGKH